MRQVVFGGPAQALPQTFAAVQEATPLHAVHAVGQIETGSTVAVDIHKTGQDDLTRAVDFPQSRLSKSANADDSVATDSQVPFLSAEARDNQPTAQDEVQFWR